ncbi:peptidoglycan DD-metalloendopeptidase family protein [Vibrio salinus]|uniref:peptidoglycan DD-metalloendopeptidase family protein n=1 Tax=Vibrio salinus TaxID=2899784 RepID=UPI001E2A6536|nr:peptidoglycan DD-metalloendopeptidase family protein [Vibrio salinus]MCE0493339.1 peptidoglycan DD-metalloendopeptidase family protein [Vibrio salinus]
MLSIFARLPLLHKILIGLISAVIVFSMIFLPSPSALRKNEKHLEIGRHYPLSINKEALAPGESIPPTAVLRWERHIVKSGESAAVLFQRIGLSSRLLYEITASSVRAKQQLSRLKPGNKLVFGFNQENKLIQLRRTINPYESFLITRTPTGFKTSIDKKEIHYQYNYTEATIVSNFWNAAKKAGLTGNQIMELAGIFGWDVDFALDIRKGDQFRLLYQEKVVEGEVVGKGNIIAAEFINQGDTFKAILDDTSGNYYDENGRAMKKAFLRAPLDFRRVSSNFNPRRLHPVTGRIRPHRGTDYVAPIGTPIWAAGDGVVIKSSYNQFNGNYVFIKHSNTYITKYLHLKRRLVKTGQRVKQGQTIGQLGRTGRVTGAHLHYEFLVHGVHKNPRTVKLPESKSLAGSRKQTFLASAKIKLAQMKHYSLVLTAKR